MTVADLIAALSTLPADAPVFVLDDDTACEVRVVERGGRVFVYGLWDERVAEPVWNGLCPPWGDA